MLIGISTHVNRLISLNTPRNLCRRFLATVHEIEIKDCEFDKIVPSNKTKRLPKARRILSDYVSTNVTREEKSSIPRSLLTTKKEIPFTGYIINKEASSSIKAILETQNLDTNGTVIEICPGLGVLTNNLIDLGFKHITCFEECLKFSKFLKSKELPIKIILRRFLRLAELHHIDKEDGENRVGQLLQRVQRSPDSRKLYIFGVAPRVNVTDFIIKSIVTQAVLHDPNYGWDSPCYYLLVSPRTHYMLTAKPDSGFLYYRSITILFQLLLNWEELARFPRQIFLPWESPFELSRDSSARGKGPRLYDENSCYLMKMTVNEKMVNELGKERVAFLWFFVKNNLYSRNFNIIPKFETWMPNSGPELIRKGFSIYSKFGDLTPSEILDLFKEFVSLPDFQNSSFIDASDKYFRKFENSEEGGGASDTDRSGSKNSSTKEFLF